MANWQLRNGLLALWIAASVMPTYAQGFNGSGMDPLPLQQPDPRIARALSSIRPQAVQADMAKLVSFGTRNTLSSVSPDLPAGQGILPAADWIEEEFRRIAAACGGCLEVKRDDFTEPGSTEPQARIQRPTRLVNVYAILHGTEDHSSNRDTTSRAPWVLVTGHYDSRASDVLNANLTSPGANDDASGVAVSLESARALSTLKLTGTVVFVAVAGEEQGLNGSRHLARLARNEGWPLIAVLNDDIVGGDTTPGDTLQDKTAVRVFSEAVPSTATPDQIQQILKLGGENDSPSRELARAVAELAPQYLGPGLQRLPSPPGGARSNTARQVPGFHPVLIQRRDRYLRGGDHTSFNAEGFAAIRFTEWRENFDHQHQTLRTEHGVEYGDYLKFVDLDYVVNVARLNAAVLASLADAPTAPQQVRIMASELGNDSDLRWTASAFAPPGTTYEVVWRETDEVQWSHGRSAGTQTHLKLNVSKDNVLFGVRAVAPNGHRSLPVTPVPAR